MRNDPEKHRRRSIRLRGYDYAQPGAYFVTLCLQQRECLLGEIESEEMVRNEAGEMVETWWKELPHRFPTCGVDAFVVMPNHVHGVIVIREATGADLHVDPDRKNARTRAPLPRLVQGSRR